VIQVYLISAHESNETWILNTILCLRRLVT